MALIEALGNGISGMLSQQVAIGVLSNNIANVNTTGFKDQNVLFKDVFYKTLAPAQGPSPTTGGINPEQSGLGVQVSAIDSNFQEGAVQQDGINTHMLLQGDGFFIVQRTGCPTEYTRDGSFTLDANNQLVNADGLKVQGWTADANGNINTGVIPADLTIPVGSKASAVATSNVTYGGTLDSSTPLNAATPYTTSVDIYDSLGTKHTLDLSWTRTASNTWQWTATTPGDATVTSLTQSANSMTFDSNGQALTGLKPTVSLTFSSGASAQTSTLDFSRVSQLDNPDQGVPPTPASTLAASNQNGFPPGTLSTFTVGTDGVITGQFSNGQFKAVGQVAVATFANNQGLSRVGNNNYLPTADSGTPKVETAEACDNKILGGALEQSNVDVTTEFSRMIVTQRAFQANSRVITVSDDMLQQALQIVRQ